MKFLARLGNLLRNLLPLDNPAPVMVVLFIFVAIFVLCMVLGRRAHGAALDDLGVQISSGATVIRGPAPVLGIAFDLPVRKVDAIRSSMTLIGHSRFQGTDYPNNYAFAVQYVTGFGHADIALGPSWMINPGPYNGSNVNFNLSFGWRFTRWPVSLWYNHFSCGGACTPNYGRDMALVGFRF